MTTTKEGASERLGHLHCPPRGLGWSRVLLNITHTVCRREYEISLVRRKAKGLCISKN